jgi:hypothetical protein
MTEIRVRDADNPATRMTVSTDVTAEHCSKRYPGGLAPTPAERTREDQRERVRVAAPRLGEAIDGHGLREGDIAANEEGLERATNRTPGKATQVQVLEKLKQVWEAPPGSEWDLIVRDMRGRRNAEVEIRPGWRYEIERNTVEEIRKAEEARRQREKLERQAAEAKGREEEAERRRKQREEEAQAAEVQRHRLFERQRQEEEDERHAEEAAARHEEEGRR